MTDPSSEYIEGALVTDVTRTTSFETYSGSWTGPVTLTETTPSPTTLPTTGTITSATPYLTNKIFSAETVVLETVDTATTQPNLTYSTLSPFSTPSPPTDIFYTTASSPTDIFTTDNQIFTRTNQNFVTDNNNVDAASSPPPCYVDCNINDTITLCTQCDLMLVVGCLILCLVVLGILTNLLCYSYFLKKVRGMVGIVYSIISLSDVLLCLVLVPVAVSYITYDGAGSTTLKYCTAWYYVWNFVLRWIFYLLSLLAFLVMIETLLHQPSCRVVCLFVVLGSLGILLLTLIPLALQPTYKPDMAFLMCFIDTSVAASPGAGPAPGSGTEEERSRAIGPGLLIWARVYDGLLGLFVIVAILVVVLCSLHSCCSSARGKTAKEDQETLPENIPLKKIGSDDGQTSENVTDNICSASGPAIECTVEKVQKNCSRRRKTARQTLVSSIMFTAMNLIMKTPLVVIDMYEKYLYSQSRLSSQFVVALMALLLSSSLLNSAFYLTRSKWCRQYLKSLFVGSASRAQPQSKEYEYVAKEAEQMV